MASLEELAALANAPQDPAVEVRAPLGEGWARAASWRVCESGPAAAATLEYNVVR